MRNRLMIFSSVEVGQSFAVKITIINISNMRPTTLKLGQELLIDITTIN